MKFLPLLLWVLAGSASAQQTISALLQRNGPYEQLMQSILIVHTDDSKGTGFIVETDGLVVTNAHVVNPLRLYDAVRLETSNLKEINGVIVGINHDLDLALIRIISDRKSWPALPIEDSKWPEINSKVFALGNPNITNFTLTNGVVSQINCLTYGRCHIQTDAALNPGNSGGPLFNESFKVIGIVGAEIPADPCHRGSTGLGFAIPARYITQALKDYHQFGHIYSSKIDLTLEESDQLEGAWVNEVAAGSSAETQGLRRGDRILAVDGIELPQNLVKAVLLYYAMVRDKIPGETMALRIERHNPASWKERQELELRATVEPLTSEDPVAESDSCL